MAKSDLDTTMQGVPQPSTQGAPGQYDANKGPFSKPRSSGGIPVKFFEQVSGTPGKLETTLEDKNLVK